MNGIEAYEWRVGRWSRLVGRSFVEWLRLPAGLHWLDVGCGAGALSLAILETADPSSLAGIDPSADDLAIARRVLGEGRAQFQLGTAEALPHGPASFDAVVSGLAFHFFSDAPLAFREMRRVAVPGGSIAGYVWDFGGEFQVARKFWDAAIAVDGAAAEADQASVFAFCKPETLRQLFEDAGLRHVEVRPLAVTARFPDFETYWEALSCRDWTGGRFACALPPAGREAIRERLRHGLPIDKDGGVSLVAQAWAARGVSAP